MFYKILVIAFLRVGSVIMDANLQEFCSRKYFDSFNVQNTGNLRIDFQLSRRIDSKSYHSWRLLMEEHNEVNTGSDIRGFKTIDMSYELKGGQTPSSGLSQPKLKDCEIQMQSRYWKGNTKSFNWIIDDIKIISDNTKSQTMNLTQTSQYYYDERFVKTSANVPEATTIWLNSSSIWYSGLFCRPFNKQLYVIVEKTDSMNDLDRRQFVSRLTFNMTPENLVIRGIKMTTVSPKLQFWLDSMNTSIVDFLGIQCPDIDQYTVPTDTLFIAFWILLVMAIILVLLNVIVAHYRNKWIKFPTESVDGTDVTTYDSEASRRRKGPFGFTSEERMKGLKLLGA